MSIDFEVAQNALFRDVPLRHRTRIAVLGIPVHFESNAPAVIATAESAFAAWRDAPATRPEVDEVSVRIIVQPGDEGGAEHARLYFRVIGDRVLFGSHGSAGIADPARREATAFVTPGLVADRDHFRYGVVEAMTLSLITRLDRQPFHAAAIVRAGSALLLAAPSGVGKSSVAYAALRADRGISVLSEDTVFLQARPRLRVWGLPGFVHLPPHLRDTLPELAHLVPAVMANGKTKLAVDLRALDRLPGAPVVERAALCILSRGAAQPGLSHLSSRQALARLESSLNEPGFDVFAETIRTPLAHLAAGGAWLLELGDDPRAAVPWLEEMLDAIALSAA
jgi:hypothetical protein